MAGLQQGSQWWLLQFCALFATNRAQLGALVNRPFVSWIEVQKIVDDHAKKQYRANAVMAAMDQ